MQPNDPKEQRPPQRPGSGPAKPTLPDRVPDPRFLKGHQQQKPTASKPPPAARPQQQSTQPAAVPPIAPIPEKPPEKLAEGGDPTVSPPEDFLSFLSETAPPIENPEPISERASEIEPPAQIKPPENDQDNSVESVEGFFQNFGREVLPPIPTRPPGGASKSSSLPARINHNASLLAPGEDPTAALSTSKELVHVKIDDLKAPVGTQGSSTDSKIPGGETIAELLTAVGGPLSIPDETRKICVLYGSGLMLVSESHRNSPLVRSVVSLARRQGFQVNEPPQYVTPSIIQQAYYDAERLLASSRTDDNAIRRKINYVLSEAVKLNTNDIHIETGPGQTKIQLRIDGSLKTWEIWTQKEGEMFVAAVYSHADIGSGVTANWNEPMAATLSHKSGPDALTLPSEVGGVRCQWMPLTTGRYLNMRLNYDGGKTLGENVAEADVDSLGFNAEQTALVRHLREIPGAMRMICGPTGQGKTTTLRVMLSRRMYDTEYRLNCLMVEDPPEGGVKGARQIGVSSVGDEKQRARLLSDVMRASLRLDPDIVMLGEIRDFETATMAFRLALTGRQIYTTTHVYGALAIPQRVRDLGIEQYLVYDHHLVCGLMSQRLARKSCPHCKVHWKEAKNLIPKWDEVMARTRAGIVMMHHIRKHGFEMNAQMPLEEADLSNIFFADPTGCDKCSGGRTGRTVVVEVVQADGTLMGLLQKNEMKAAQEYWLSPDGLNGINMLWHGIEKVHDGMLAPIDIEFELGPLASPQEVDWVARILGEFRE